MTNDTVESCQLAQVQSDQMRFRFQVLFQYLVMVPSEEDEDNYQITK